MRRFGSLRGRQSENRSVRRRNEAIARSAMAVCQMLERRTLFNVTFSNGTIVGSGNVQVLPGGILLALADEFRVRLDAGGANIRSGRTRPSTSRRR
jgi:hypothetical protein